MSESIFPREKHLYRYGAKKKVEKEFEERYGKKRGKKIYGAVIHKVKLEQIAKRRRK